MKVIIDADEWYPVFSMYAGEERFLGGKAVEMTDEKYAEYVRIFTEFNKAQDELSVLAGWEEK